MANNITLEPGGPRPPSGQEQVHIRTAIGAAAEADLDATNVTVANLATSTVTPAELAATNAVVDSLVASRDLELMDESRVYEVGEAFHYDGKNFRCDILSAIGETPDTTPGNFSEIGATPTGLAIKELYEVQTKAFTDAQFDKLDLIEPSATADQTPLEIKTAYEGQPNAFTDLQFLKLAGIEALADVTDSVNVDAAGAVMVTDTDVTGMAFGINEDTMVSASSTKFPTQSSVKNYVDANLSGVKSYQGGYNATSNTPNLDNPPLALNIAKGDLWDVIVAGQLFGVDVAVGDTIRANKNNPVLEADWVVVQGNLTPAAIKTQYESNAETNALTDANLDKLNNIEPLATADQTAAEIKALYESEADTNVFDNVAESKVGNITVSAPVDLDVISADSHEHTNQSILDQVEVPYILVEAIKLAQIEQNADKTDSTNVISSLSGALIPSVTPNVADNLVIQDVSDANSLKTITVQSVVDVVNGAGGATEQDIYGLREATTDATTTRLSAEAGGSYLVIPAQSVFSYTIKVSAYNTTDDIAAAWHIRGAIRRNNANSTVIVGNVIEELFSEGTMSGCIVGVTADNTNNALNVAVNGLAGKNMNWTATVTVTSASA